MSRKCRWSNRSVNYGVPFDNGAVINCLRTDLLEQAGYTVDDFTERQKEVLKYLDVLVDGPFQQENRNLSLTMRGSSNQRVIDVKKSLAEEKIVLVEA